MENWEKLTKEIMRLIEANITATIDPEDNDGEPVLEIESSLEKSIGEIISSELESAKHERTKEILEWINTQRDADLGDDDIVYISDLINYLKRPLHQNNNEQGGK